MFKRKAKPPADIKHWYKDRYQHLIVQRKLLVWITITSLLCTLALIITIQQLTPLKSVEPFVIQVDPKSGIVQTVNPLEFSQITNNEAVSNYFIVQYVRAREGYDAANLMYNYNLVRITSEPKAIYPAFLREADPNNPASNVARLGNAGLRKIKIKSISYIKPQTAQVRFTIDESGDNLSNQYHKIALVGFEYTKMELSNDDRFMNPLGFRVLQYRVDEEVFQP